MIASGSKLSSYRDAVKHIYTQILRSITELKEEKWTEVQRFEPRFQPTTCNPERRQYKGGV